MIAHVKKAEEIYAAAQTRTVKELEEAISHTKMGHADVATKPTEKAIQHIEQSGY